MAIYETPIWLDGTRPFPTRGISARGWRAVAGPTPDPLDRRAVSEHFETMRLRYKRYSTHVISTGNASWIAPQLLIDAKSESIAVAAFSLINAANCLLEGNLIVDIGEEEIFCTSVGEDEYNVCPAPTESYRKCYYIDCATLGTFLAAKASTNRQLQYAIFRLYLSYQLWCAHYMNFHPRYSPKLYGVTQRPLVHATLAAALTQAYSAIEQLQLEPRPVGNKPVKQGSNWNGQAFADLAYRLEQSGLSINEKVVWTYRGPPTRLHKTDRAPRGIKMSWSVGVVRDEEVDFGDALLGASNLRSKASAHKLGTLAASITPYDVHNVQHLARRVILAEAGLYRSGAWATSLF